MKMIYFRKIEKKNESDVYLTDHDAINETNKNEPLYLQLMRKMKMRNI